MVNIKRALKRRRVVALALGLGGLLAVAPPLRAESLNEAMAKAYAGNPQLQAQRARLRAVDEEISQALSGWRPTVTVNTSVGKSSLEINTASDRFQDRSPRTSSLTVNQPLYRGGRTLADTRRAETAIQGERARLFATEQTILVAAVTAYMNVVQGQAVLELTANNERVLRRQLDAARDRFSVGEVTRTDVSQAEARVERAVASRVQSEGTLAVSRANYARVVGEAPAVLAQPPLPEGLPTGIAAATEAARVNNPEVVAADFSEQSQLATVRLTVGELYPRANLVGTLQRDLDTNSEGSLFEQSRVVAELVVPLYQAGGVEARVRQQKQVASQRRLELDDTRRRAIEFTTQNYEALETAGARLGALDAQIRASQIALDGVEQEAQVGTRTVLDVLDAEQELLDANVQFVQSQRDQIVAAYNLLAGMGIATAEALGLPVDLYDFRANYFAVRDKWIGTDANTLTPLPKY